MNTQKLNFGLKACILLILAATVGILYLGNKHMVAVAQETARLKAQVQVSDKQISVYQATKNKVDTLGYVNDLANKVLPADQEQSAIVAEISQFALRSDLTIQQITFVDPVTGAATASPKSSLAIPKGVQVVPITIQFQAGSTYPNILGFLKTIENNQRKMQVTNVSLTPDEKDRQSLSNVSISLNLYAKQQSTAKVKI